MKVKNKNFICDKMQKRDLEDAFVNDRKTFIDFASDLIAAGYVKRMGDRFFTPTTKLLNDVFLPENGMLYLEEHQRRFLSNHSTFYFQELLVNFDRNETVIYAMIKRGYIKYSTDKRYRKSSEFEEFLADGGDTIKVKDV